MRIPFFHRKLVDETRLDETLQDPSLGESSLNASQEGGLQESVQSMPSLPPSVQPGASLSQNAVHVDLVREFDRLNAKLDYLKSMLDQLLERVKRLEEKRW